MTKYALNISQTAIDILKSAGIDVEKEIVNVIQQEIDYEIIVDIHKASSKSDNAAGIPNYMCAKYDELYPKKQEIMDWLTENFSDAVIHEMDYIFRVDFSTPEQLVLFKTFWL